MAKHHTRPGRTVLDVVHFMHSEKFVNDFVRFVNQYFNPEDHLFLVRKVNSFDVDDVSNVKTYPQSAFSIRRILAFVYYATVSRKVILHGLFYKELVFILFFCPWILRKSCWLIWGGDIYGFESKPKSILSAFSRSIKKRVIKNVGAIATYLEGDFQYARDRFGVIAERRDCFLYPSNIFVDRASRAGSREAGAGLTVLLGNSADPSNNHEMLIDLLSPHNQEDIRIICPLSYGPIKHARKIKSLGEARFGARFHALTDFVPRDEYWSVLERVDIAVFGHLRQQAMGNIIQLLGMGKKVCIRRSISPWLLFESLGIKVFDLEGLQLIKIQPEIAAENSRKVKEYFSAQNLFNQYQVIFG